MYIFIKYYYLYTKTLNVKKLDDFIIIAFIYILV